jgi:hypothetical protein
MVAAEGDADLTRDAADAEDRIESGESGPDDRAVIRSRDGRGERDWKGRFTVESRRGLRRQGDGG